MGILLDILLIAILVFFVFSGIKKGAVKTIFSMFSFVIALILTILFASPFSQFVAKTKLGEQALDTFRGNVKKQIQTTIDSAEDGLYNTTEDVLEKANVPQSMKDSLLKRSDYMVRNKDVPAIDAVTDAVANAYLSLISSVVLFVLILILLRIVRIFAMQLFKLPLLKEINTFIGAVAGLVNGMFTAFFVLSAIHTLSLLPSCTFLTPWVSDSFIYKYLYETNLLLTLLI